mmetsp:Transcript_48871/g.136825  ORF Transcript_48871/g.136825 Transcript_48871/m.136825 type:complete len:523 (+) Transcript_48871:1093-2661(+)
MAPRPAAIVIWFVQAELPPKQRVRLAPAGKVIALDDARLAVFAAEVVGALALVGGTAKTQKRQLPRGGFDFHRAVLVPRHALIRGSAPFLHGLVLVDPPHRESLRLPPIWVLVYQHFQHLRNVDVVTADGRRFRRCPKGACRDAYASEDDDHPEDNEDLAADATQRIEQGAGAKLLQCPGLRLFAGDIRLRHPGPIGASPREYSPATAPAASRTEALPRRWSLHSANAATAGEAFEVTLVNDERRGEESNAEDPVHEDHHTREEAKVRDARQGREGPDHERAASRGCGNHHGRKTATVGPCKSARPVARNFWSLQRRLLPGVVNNEDVVGADAEDHVHDEGLQRADLLPHDDGPQAHGHRQGEEDFENAAQGEEKAFDGPPHVEPDHEQRADRQEPVLQQEVQKLREQDRRREHHDAHPPLALVLDLLLELRHALEPAALPLDVRRFELLLLGLGGRVFVGGEESGPRVLDRLGRAIEIRAEVKRSELVPVQVRRIAHPREHRTLHRATHERLAVRRVEERR